MVARFLDLKSAESEHPFITGMRTAFDMYGANGMKAHELVHSQWREAMAEPLLDADESIRETIAAVNVDFERLLAEHSE